MKIKHTISLAVASLFFISLANCKQKTTDAQAGLKGHFTFVKGNVMVNNQKARIGSTIGQSDVVEIADKSAAIIQFATGAMLTLKSNTVLQVSQLQIGPDGKPTVALHQEAGSTFSKIVPGKAKYAVSTPTAVAGVRGTAFEVTVTKSRTTAVKLLHGKVAVAKKQAKAAEAKPTEEAVVLKEGTAIEVTNEAVSKPKKLAKAEIKTLKELDKIKMIEDTETLQNPEALQEKQAEVVPVKVEKLILAEKAATQEEDEKTQQTEKPAKKKEITLEELKKKYGALSQIITRDGKQYVGAFRQDGANIAIYTVKGKVMIPVGEVAKVSPLN